jgi:hypothetical protein
VFEVLAPTANHFGKLRDFLQQQLPNEGFPYVIEKVFVLKKI